MNWPINSFTVALRFIYNSLKVIRNCVPADIDECADSSTNECSQHCLNHDGGFSCACDDGYNVDDNGVCRGEQIIMR